MKKLLFLLAAFVLFCSHDMFLKMGTYFLQPNTAATIQLYNGTFDKSENVITRNRMNDVSLVGNGIRSNIDTNQWTEQGHITVLNFKTGEAGTWVAGVSTNPNNIELSAKEFNEYLEHDGVFDMLDWRKQNETLDKNAVEKYSKHVKTIFQVGDKKSKDWQKVLGYPIEFVPMRNPYDAKVGEALKVKLLWKGQPLSNQLVYVGSDAHKHDGEHSHEHDNNSGEGHHHDATRLRTDADGIVSLNIANEGHWYLRTIQMTHSDESGLTHESNWATLTFEVGHGHTHSSSSHSHSHAEEAGTSMLTYAYWIGGFVLLTGLFFWLRRGK